MDGALPYSYLDSSSTCQRVADFAFSNVTEGFVIVIATIDVSVKCAGKSYVLLDVLLVCGAPCARGPCGAGCSSSKMPSIGS